ncbi:MAG: DNA-protecting protein DprA, partial [Oscillospiraceae bacterium]|nr:DNA-protecting protein DprA [Oscillospiraceae bacterium]
MSSLKYWVWLSSVSGVSAAVAGILLRRFETPEQIYYADASEFKEIGIKPADISLLSRKNIEFANRILSKCEEKHFRIITLQDVEYPDRLRNIYDPPIVLYIRGTLPVIDEEAAVAIVGTRSSTPPGIAVSERIGYELARYGLLVVSGLARGIDSAAAKGALRGGGRVLGVLGCGLDVVYPSENEDLYDDVTKSGAIISEYPPGTPPHGGNFPVRNRILSGVSLGVAVVEAP